MRNIGFDGEKYIALQSEKIEERIKKFSGRLYLEIGGKFLFDGHASRVLPGFFPDSKKQIFLRFKDTADIIFCVNARDIKKNRTLSEGNNYTDVCFGFIQEIQLELGITPFISINRISEENKDAAEGFKKLAEEKGFQAFFRYEISGYPENTAYVLSESGYGHDEYIPVEKKLVLVTGAASSSGKMSTCLGQIYQDFHKNIESGYAKYETFPIWNIPLTHPVNLAYEAATADISDHNMLDPYYKKSTGKISVNYNRDVEAFEIVMDLAKKFLPEQNFTRQYSSPTDMGISNAGFCITDERAVRTACEDEVKRRMEWYKEHGDERASEVCREIFEGM